jgi:hypothetical protein
MNAIERRALYNLLRMNWLKEPDLNVESWQVEDYGSMDLTTLFEKLQQFDIHLNKSTFVHFADECDSPEELTEHLIGDWELSSEEEDQIYLIVFELWRRLLNEKPSLSILCYELDYQIFLYDHDKLDNPLALHDALTHFLQILEKNADHGVPPEEAFRLISSYCANDIEGFLYDFISQLIDEGDYSYASELLENFAPYWKEHKWFKLLCLREAKQGKMAERIISEIQEEHTDEPDLDFLLDFLYALLEMNQFTPFLAVWMKTLSFVENEKDFQDMLELAIDYFHLTEQDDKEIALSSILEKRSLISPSKSLSKKDPDLATVIAFFHPS